MQNPTHPQGCPDPVLCACGCGELVVPDTRAVVFGRVAWRRTCWLAIVEPPQLTALEKRQGRNWRRGRCRVAG